MPQMAPLKWLFLFFFFITIFIMFNILNFFIFKPLKTKKTPLSLNFPNLTKINWKW